MEAKLSIGKVIAGSIAIVIDRWPQLVRALAILFVISVVIGWMPVDPQNPLLTGILLGIQLPVHTLFAITTHRVVLMGEGAVPRWGIGGWGRREISFILHLLGLTFAAMFLMALGLVLPPPLAVLVAIGIAVVFSSLSLVFPAIAVGDELDVAGAWNLAEGYRLLMVVAVCLFPFVLVLMFALLGFLVPQAIYLIAPVFQGLMTIFAVTALSVAYAEIRRVKGYH